MSSRACTSHRPGEGGGGVSPGCDSPATPQPRMCPAWRSALEKLTQVLERDLGAGRRVVDEEEVDVVGAQLGRGSARGWRGRWRRHSGRARGSRPVAPFDRLSKCREARDQGPGRALQAAHPGARRWARSRTSSRSPCARGGRGRTGPAPPRRRRARTSARCRNGGCRHPASSPAGPGACAARGPASGRRSRTRDGLVSTEKGARLTVCPGVTAPTLQSYHRCR